jgi:hypothetical protein
MKELLANDIENLSEGTMLFSNKSKKVTKLRSKVKLSQEGTLYYDSALLGNPDDSAVRLYSNNLEQSGIFVVSEEDLPLLEV